MTAAPAASPLLVAVLDKIAALASLDIAIGEPCGYVITEGSWADIGMVIIDESGRVEAVPCMGATAGQIRKILNHAEIAKADGPVGCEWVHIDGLGWMTSVFESIGGVRLPPSA